jgi:hypothetical protein
MGDGQTVAYKLLGILHHIAPDKEAQNVCTRIFNSVAPGVEQDKTMCCALADGYLYGNWPWELVKLKVGK